MNPQLKLRLQTAGVLIPLALALLYFGGVALVLAACLCLVIINVEYVWLLPGLSKPTRLLFVGYNLLPGLGYTVFGQQGLLVGLCFGALLVCNHIVLRAWWLNSIDPEMVPAKPLLLGFGYTGIIGANLTVVSSFATGNKLIFLTMLAVSLCDTCAYFVGRSVGGPKLAPAMSPNKTVSGAVGGLGGAMLGVCIANYFVGFGLGLLASCLCGMAIAYLGQVGDLFESFVKRLSDAKDSSQLLPGHGGLLDRLDALLFALPVALFLHLALGL